MSTMLYKSGGKEKLHGVMVQTIVVKDEQVKEYLADGWLDSPQAVAETQSVKPAESADAPTRAELEIKANELGIKFDGRTSDKTLLSKIDEATK